MTDPIRAIGILGILAIVLMTVIYVLPSVGVYSGYDGGTLSELLKRIAEEQRRGAALDRGNGVVGYRLDGKEVVIKQLLQGRLTLLEAAARFKALNDFPPESPNESFKVFPGSSDGERICRQVISWAQSTTMLKSSGEADAVVRRLEAELRDDLRRDPLLSLPGD